MLTDYFESFTLLEERRVPDGCGGVTKTVVPAAAFRGALTHQAGEKRDAHGRMMLSETPMLLHDLEVTLRPGDPVRRDRDGSVWRVCGLSGDMRTPAFSGLAFAQAPVERWVGPC